MKKKPFQFYLLTLIAFIGLLFSVYLSQHFYEIRNGTSGFKSFCNISQEMNCDIVTASPYAEFAFGIPISTFSAGWFLSFFLVSFFAYSPLWRKETLRALFGFSAFGVLMAFPYLFFMLYKIKTFCLFCLGIDLLNLIALFLSLSLKPKWFSTDKLDFSKWKVFVTICTVSVALAVVGLTLTFHSPSANALEAEEMARRILDSPVFPVNNPNNDKEEFLSFGPKTAPITIVEFSDFQCPFCRIGALSLNSAISRYPDQIRVIFRNFPLDSTCNASVHQTVHPVACEAARVAICAHQKDRFEPIYQELFENQAMFKPGYPTQIARLQGFSLPSLEKCMDSAETNFAITKDIEDAKLLQVESTPTFFINGHKHAGVLSVPVWIKVIDHLLTK